MQQENRGSAMDRIWAPWRMEYMQELKAEDGCFLCNALQQDRDEDNLVLWRGKSCFAMMNRYPYNNGHLLVAPNGHKADFPDLAEEELLGMMKMVARCEKNLCAAVSPNGFNIGLNIGQAAGAGVPGHLHWHIVPRWHADSNFMPVVASTKVIPQSLHTLWKLLREIDDE